MSKARLSKEQRKAFYDMVNLPFGVLSTVAESRKQDPVTMTSCQQPDLSFANGLMASCFTEDWF